jgi:polyhydroxyalkanoate synthesis repressor PhaR
MLETAMPASTVIIKKYENRRLYDTSNSRYVNLEDIAQMVREGTDVQVLDAGSGEDLTRIVLSQIVVESAKGPNSTFPLDMLRQMIVASGQVSREGLLGYMKAMADMYQNTYRTFAPGLAPFDFSQPKPEPADTASGTAQPPSTPQPSVDELRRRVEELERLIPKTRVRRPAAKRKRSSKPKR